MDLGLLELNRLSNENKTESIWKVWKTDYSKKDRQKKEDERKARNKENLRKTIEDLYGPIPESVGTCSNWRKELYDC